MGEVLTIPVLPCASMPETLAFYRALGFEVTHEQTTPNVYAATRRGEINLHFMGIKGLDFRDVYSTCLVMVPEVERLHQTFAEGLRQAYGKLPIAGFPRISRMRPGQSRFTVVDVAGNSLMFIKQGEPDPDDEAASGASAASRLGKALRTAERLRDFKNDDTAAAKVLDVALAQKEEGAPMERARALAARIELAVALGTRRARGTFAPSSMSCRSPTRSARRSSPSWRLRTRWGGHCVLSIELTWTPYRCVSIT